MSTDSVLQSDASIRGRPIRLLHCVSTFYPAIVYGGTVECMWNLCRGLADLCFDQTVLTSDANGAKRLTIEEKAGTKGFGISIRYCRRLIWRDLSISYLLALPSLVWRCDVAHVSPPYSLPAIPAMLCAWLFRKPLVFSPHGAYQRYENSRGTYRKAVVDKIIRLIWQPRWLLHLTAENEVKESMSATGASSYKIVPNCLPMPATLSESTFTEQRLKLLFIGRLDKKKGIENLLNALAIASPSLNKGWELVVAGSGERAYEAGLRDLVARLDLDSRVRFVGLLDSSRRAAAYRDCHVTVVPSFVENFGMVVVEALANARAVIASTGTPWAILNEIEAGVWCPNDPASLASALVFLASADLLRIGRNGRRLAESVFSTEIVAAQMKDLYLELVNTECLDG
jgi:glycosyltransferase involved in cell wall biosynthesis